MVGPTMLCDGNGCAGQGLILPGLEPGLGMAAGLGWWPWPRFAVALLQPMCPQDPAELGVWGYGVGSAAPLCLPGLGLRPPMRLARGMDPIFSVDSFLLRETEAMEKSCCTSVPLVYLHNPPSAVELDACTQNRAGVGVLAGQRHFPVAAICN